MEKGIKEITKQPMLNVGIVGHIDHGKTTLLWKLSGKWTDTHSEELKRGITIKLGYADVVIKKCSQCPEPECYTVKEKCKNGHSALPVKHISFVDTPGHEMLMATMLSGAAIVDAALLVIAANEPCPRPQTREHLIALEVKNVKHIIVVQNKVDLVSKEEAEKNFAEIRKFLDGTIAENAPIIPCSSLQEINLDAIIAEIDKIPLPVRDVKSKPLFFVARSFDINRPGAKIDNLRGGVLGGILKQGVLKKGEQIEIKPGLSVKKHNITEYKTIITKIDSLQSGNSQLDEIIPSGSIAIQTELDPLLTKADSLTGCVISTVGNLPEVQNKLKVRIHLFKEVVGTEKVIEVLNIKTSEILLLSINTSITVGTVTKVVGNEIELVLKIPVIVISGTKIGIARNVEGHYRLIGWGEIV